MFVSFDIRLPGSASRPHVESLGKPRDSTSDLEALLGKLNIKRHSPSILCILIGLMCLNFATAGTSGNTDFSDD